ncbi:lasso RiPP family leader peptide-containing protein [Streptomyces hainanensis]|uniref:Lasso RiPP family leader peptide-containing protein n=1 Tax=Streptomyces hainanensis TaxID=402648 RepID=A0A4R4TFR1_9ACTN|nr:lasso RiPP family leader peptide-containing protein [Streptomyces hainanensis]
MLVMREGFSRNPYRDGEGVIAVEQETRVVEAEVYEPPVVAEVGTFVEETQGLPWTRTEALYGYKIT